MQSRILKRLNDNAQLVNETLGQLLLKKDTGYEILRDSMRYSTLAGGKRIRPFLAIEFYRLFSGDDTIEKVMPFACAIELIHTYSLIHDDLPCMDDDDLRRGKPTNHVVYGEATALLAGDALLTYAFEVAASNKAVSADAVVRALGLLAKNAGVDGMVGGQQLDLIGEMTKYSEEVLREMQNLKTGKLIEAASMLGLIAAGYDDKKAAAVKKYADCIGLAFQITDDMLDVTASAAELGKTVGSDGRNGKTTFMTYMTVDEAYEYTKRLTGEACDAVKEYAGSEILTELAYYLIDRRN
nr:polyprenyl synthetase family protein [Clostridia bacterium]